MSYLEWNSTISLYFSTHLAMLFYNAWYCELHLMDSFIFSHNSKDVNSYFYLICRKDVSMVKHNAHLVSYYSDTYIALLSPKWLNRKCKQKRDIKRLLKAGAK